MTAYGASLPREDGVVGAAMWGPADASEQSDAGAGWTQNGLDYLFPSVSGRFASR
jgi:hypothetical protein